MQQHTPYLSAESEPYQHYQVEQQEKPIVIPKVLEMISIVFGAFDIVGLVFTKLFADELGVVVSEGDLEGMAQRKGLMEQHSTVLMLV